MKKILFLIMFFALSLNVFAELINSSPKEISKSEIIEKFEALNPVYYEMTSRTSSSMPLPGGDAISDEHAWYKKGYWRTDIYSKSANAKKRINIVTPESSYYYNLFSNETKKTEGFAGQDLKSFLFQFLFSTLKKGEWESYKIVGTEEIDGKTTTIIEIVLSPVNKRVGDTDIVMGERKIKAWIWNEKGVPLKQEERRKDVQFPLEYTTVTEYRNYSFDEIPDEIFDILKEKLNTGEVLN